MLLYKHVHNIHHGVNCHVTNINAAITVWIQKFTSCYFLLANCVPMEHVIVINIDGNVLWLVML